MMELMERLFSEGWDAREIFSDMLKKDTAKCSAGVTTGQLGCYWYLLNEPSLAPLVEELPEESRTKIKNYLPKHVNVRTCPSCSYTFYGLEILNLVYRNETAKEAGVSLQ